MIQRDALQMLDVLDAAGQDLVGQQVPQPIQMEVQRPRLVVLIGPDPGLG